MKSLRVLSVFGTRPEAIKMCPLALTLRRRSEFESMVCVTAQHREMLDSVMETFALRPDYDLNIMEAGQTLTSITGKVLTQLGGRAAGSKARHRAGPWRHHHRLRRSPVCLL